MGLSESGRGKGFLFPSTVTPGIKSDRIWKAMRVERKLMFSCREEDGGNDLVGNEYFGMYSCLTAEIVGVRI
jgi:hypothetical protein